MRKGPEYEIWVKEFADNPCRLAQGVGTRIPKGKHKIFFIPRGKVSKFKTVIYGRIVIEIRSPKTETYHICLMVGGDRLEFDGVIATQYAGLVTIKMLFNSTVSTPGVRFCIFDIKDFFYGSPVINCEYRGI